MSTMLSPLLRQQPLQHFQQVSSRRILPKACSRHPHRTPGVALTPLLSARYLSTTSSSAVKNRNDRIERPRRALFSVPGADERKLQKAKGLNADSIVLDLEDGVAWDKKNLARDLVRTTLMETTTTNLEDPSPEVCVRINGLDTNECALADLQAILPCPALQSIVIPKVESAADVQFVRRMMDAHGCHEDVRILAAIESAKGMLRLEEIAAGSPKLDALIFASEDYCADLELIRTPEASELLFPRSQLVTVAKAYGLQAIDMVHIDFRNIKALEVECQRGKELGFTGKQAIHPLQIDTIQQTFVPSANDIDFAQRIVQEYQNTTSAGRGACVVDGIVVDAPVYKWAGKILQRAQVAGLLAE